MSKTLSLVLLSVMLIIVCTLPAGAESPGSTPLASSFSGGWDLRFSDEFSGTALDRTKWGTSWDGRLNNGPEQVQLFVDDAFRVRDGMLQIIAEKRQESGFRYTSGQIQTHDTFSQQYGYYELRGKPAAGHGMWSSFWLLGNTWPPEMDVLEVLGRLPDTHHTNYHWSHAVTGEHQKSTRKHIVGNLTNDFHVYGLEWLPDRMNWYLDGKPIATHTVGVRQANQPMMLLIDLAMGGWAQEPNAQTVFPAIFTIDYVRVWQRDVYPPATVTPTPTTNCSAGLVEAEQGAQSGAFRTRLDAHASGGAFVDTNSALEHAYATIASSPGRLDVCVMAPEDGVYEVWARVRSQGRNQHSFYIRVDNAPEDGYMWDFMPPDFLWHEYPVTDVLQQSTSLRLPLRAGPRWLQVWMREAGAQIDWIELRRVGDLPDPVPRTPTTVPPSATPSFTPVPTGTAHTPLPTASSGAPTPVSGIQYRIFVPLISQR